MQIQIYTSCYWPAGNKHARSTRPKLNTYNLRVTKFGATFFLEEFGATLHSSYERSMSFPCLTVVQR
jgi:hypothetical protein